MKIKLMKTCEWCQGNFSIDDFCQTNSSFYRDKRVPVCNSCLEKFLTQKNFAWPAVDKLCQYIDIPFVPKVFEDLHKKNGDKVFPLYVDFCIANQYATSQIGWKTYFDEFVKLKEEKQLESQLPEIGEAALQKLHDKWGHNYAEEDLDYLEKLHTGLLSTQNVTGALQDDQGIKLCKISLEIDNKIRDGAEFDKLLSSYDRLVKIADFTPKNAKSATDLESVGELYKWLEKSGWKNKFYDNVTRDIVDETIKNIQSFNQRLYIDEGGIGDEITRRIEALKTAAETEKYYDIDQKHEIDEYDNSGYEELLKEEDGDFKTGDEDDG